MMRRTGLCLIILCLAIGALAQKHSIGIGLGSSNDYFLDHETGVGAGARLNYDYRWKTFGNLSLTFGGALAYTTTEANYTPGLGWRTNYRWRSVIQAFRATANFEYNESFHVYGGVHLGVRFLSFQERAGVNAPPGYQSPQFRTLYAFSGVFAGVDYVLTNRFKLFGELGYDMMWFTLGLKYDVN